MCFLAKTGCYGVAVAHRGFFFAQKVRFLLKPGCYGVAVARRGFFFAPKVRFYLKTRVLRCPHSRRGFFFAQKVRFFLKPGCCGVPIPAGAFYAPKNTPQGVSRGKSSVSRRRNPSLAHTAGSTGSTGLVSSSAAQTLPSTRAGGQDDGSYNKLPQTIISTTQIVVSFVSLGYICDVVHAHNPNLRQFV